LFCYLIDKKELGEGKAPKHGPESISGSVKSINDKKKPEKGEAQGTNTIKVTPAEKSKE